MNDRDLCINCGQRLVDRNGVLVCPQCNSKNLDYSQIFCDESEDDGYIFIECPGATLYEDGTNDIIAGVAFLDDDDPTKGYRIVNHPVYAPTHNRRRRIKKDAVGKIRRCQACQDYTVRMRRREGPDFFVPSVKHPKRKKLKTIEHVVYEP